MSLRLFGYCSRAIGAGSRISINTARNVHSSPIAANNVFAKKQRQLDPEIAKMREIRKRKKLSKEILELQAHAKKPKPIDEMTVDIVSAKNIHERQRPPTELSLEEADERGKIEKLYAKERYRLARRDAAWVATRLRNQTEALRQLRLLSEHLYQAAIQPDDRFLPFTCQGPSETPPIDGYKCPDGDYIETTRSYQ